MPNRHELGFFNVTNLRRDKRLAYLQIFELNRRMRDDWSFSAID